MNIATTSVGVRELRNHLSKYLLEVRGGRSITVTDHGVPVARLTPNDSRSSLEDLIERGIASPPRRPKQAAPPPRSRTDGSVSDLIDAQRR